MIDEPRSGADCFFFFFFTEGRIFLFFYKTICELKAPSSAVFRFEVVVDGSSVLVGLQCAAVRRNTAPQNIPKQTVVKILQPFLGCSARCRVKPLEKAANMFRAAGCCTRPLNRVWKQQIDTHPETFRHLYSQSIDAEVNSV